MPRPLLAASIAAAFVALAAPQLAAAQSEPAPSSQPAPYVAPRDRAPSQAGRIALIATGATTLGLTWGASAVAGWVSQMACSSVPVVPAPRCNGLDLAIPLVGPWVHLARNENPTPFSVTLDVASGMIQAGGLALLIVGIANPWRQPPATSRQARWTVAPAGAGLAVSVTHF